MRRFIQQMKWKKKEATATRKWHQHDVYNCIFSELFFLSSSASKCDIVGGKALKTFPHFSHCTQSLCDNFSILFISLLRSANKYDRFKKTLFCFSISLDATLPILLFVAVSSELTLSVKMSRVGCVPVFAPQNETALKTRICNSLSFIVLNFLFTRQFQGLLSLWK